MTAIEEEIGLLILEHNSYSRFCLFRRDIAKGAKVTKYVIHPDGNLHRLFVFIRNVDGTQCEEVFTLRGYKIK